MNRHKTPTDRGTWLSVAEAAGIVGCSPQNFRANWLYLLSPEHIRGTRPVQVFGPGIISAAVAKALARVDDPDMAAGQSSPELERWRRARAMNEERRLAESVNELESVAEARAAVTEIMGYVARFAERTIHRHGSAVQEEWADVCKQVERTVGTRLCPPDATRRELRVWLNGAEYPIVLELNCSDREVEK